MQLSEILNLVEKDLLSVNEELIFNTKSDIKLINDIAEYIINSGGKRIRPLIVLLFAQALQVDSKVSFKLAVIAELIHTATILHDDVVDDSSMRRGRPTVNKQFNNPAAVLVGDFLYTRAFQMLSELENPQIMKLFTDSVNVIAEGEVKQLLNLGDLEITEEKYFDVIYSKTAKLFEACCQAIVMLKYPQTYTDYNYGKYGTYIGTAFQIVDDIIDYKTDDIRLGKKAGDDLAEGKPTLPLIHLKNNGSAQARSYVDAIIRQEKQREVLPVMLEFFAEFNSFEYCYAKAKEEMQKAIDCIHGMEQSQAKDALIALAKLSVQRNY